MSFKTGDFVTSGHVFYIVENVVDSQILTVSEIDISTGKSRWRSESLPPMEILSCRLKSVSDFISDLQVLNKKFSGK